MTQQMIRRFKIGGVTTSVNIEQTRETFRNQIIGMMKDEGYVPVIDLDPVWTWEWIKDDYYNFVYTWHGVYVGKDKAWETDGITNGKAIPSTRKNRLKES